MTGHSIIVSELHEIITGDITEDSGTIIIPDGIKIIIQIEGAI
jgi:hypothetical protein